MITTFGLVVNQSCDVASLCEVVEVATAKLLINVGSTSRAILALELFQAW